MLGVGWTEMLVIGVVALIVIGPKELPALMHKIGKFAGTIRRMGQDFQRELNKTTGLNEIQNVRNAITQPLKATTDAIRKEFNTTTASGAVQPSGILKPADPAAESVVNEIHAAAGMKPPVQTPAEAMKDAVTKRVAETAKPATTPIKAAPVKKAAPSKAAAAKTPAAAKKAPAAATAAKTPAKPKATPKATPAAKKAVESPAPVEALAPAKKPAAKKAVAPKAAAAKPAASVAVEPVATPAKAPAKRKPATKKT